jgi:hypothetical protein
MSTESRRTAAAGGPLPVQLIIEGRPFDAAAVRHTLRHLAMRVGWRFVRESAHRLVYAVEDDKGSGTRIAADGVVVRSNPDVATHLRTARTPVPLRASGDGSLLPFPQRASLPRPGQLDGDVVAGAHACLNLWYEQRTRPAADDGWITWNQDWMSVAGLPDPLPVADRWLDRIYDAALQVNWPPTRRQHRPVIVLTHDVDYLPGMSDLGLPRLVRALYRQCILRRRPADGLRLIGRYLGALARRRPPYLELSHIVAEERRRNAVSSFQFVVERTHPNDPAYACGKVPWKTLPAEWEVCLHGSYAAARTSGRVAAERARLSTLADRPVSGYRQHYLNFEPADLFRQVAAAGLQYDMSVGYNDRSGPRAGTYFPYRPYDLEAEHAHELWEVPFVLMDTTLATSLRLGPEAALQHAQAVLQPVINAGGCVAIIWHQEQCGGLLDPGYERVYLDLLDWLSGLGAQLATGASVLPQLNAAWEATAADNSASGPI